MIEGADELVNAVTTGLSPDGSFGQLTGSLTDSLDSVWADFFGASTPPGTTNWNAYSHQQLYDMLWQGADVGDVNAVATEWGRHATALTGFADALRGQSAALRSNWQGKAAEQAADRLAELSDRIWNAGARAGAVQQATDNAADALALARKTMPPPPPDPVTLMSSAIGAGPLSPVQAVVIGAARIFTGDAVAGMAKAEAVRVMQRYEASLLNSGQQVVPAQAGATTANTVQVGGQGGTTTTSSFTGGSGSGSGLSGGAGGTGGVPWSRLVGSAGPGAGSAVGIAPGALRSVPAMEEALESDLAAESATGEGGVYSPFMSPRSTNRDEDKPHRNRMPNPNTRYFMPDERPTVAVIGDTTDKEGDDGR